MTKFTAEDAYRNWQVSPAAEKTFSYQSTHSGVQDALFLRHKEGFLAGYDAGVAVRQGEALGLVPVPVRITVEDAYEMGRTGGSASESERALFEAYMRGHCWKFAPFNQATGCYEDMSTRMLFAVWRDRAALAEKVPVVPKAAPGSVRDDGAFCLEVDLSEASPEERELLNTVVVQDFVRLDSGTVRTKGQRVTSAEAVRLGNLTTRALRPEDLAGEAWNATYSQLFVREDGAVVASGGVVAWGAVQAGGGIAWIDGTPPITAQGTPSPEAIAGT